MELGHSIMASPSNPTEKCLLCYHLEGVTEGGVLCSSSGCQKGTVKKTLREVANCRLFRDGTDIEGD